MDLRTHNHCCSPRSSPVRFRCLSPEPQRHLLFEWSPSYYRRLYDHTVHRSSVWKPDWVTDSVFLRPIHNPLALRSDQHHSLLVWKNIRLLRIPGLITELHLLPVRMQLLGRSYTYVSIIPTLRHMLYITFL